MAKDYLLESHYIAKALDGIEFPIGKKELLEKYGDKEVRVDFDKFIKLKEKIQLIKLEEFNSAAELYSALYSL